MKEKVKWKPLDKTHVENKETSSFEGIPHLLLQDMTS